MTIAQLERLIRYHQDRYYNDKPEIPDEQFDLLWDELQRVDPENVLFAEVGRDDAPTFVKRRHIIPMNSQEKASDPNAFLQWAARVDYTEYIVQHKLDGASLELQFERGRLTYGVTRGDGTVGDDISANVRTMKGIVTDLGSDFTGAIRGEVIMTHDVHRTYFPEKANCRNAANGIMKRKDGVGSEFLTVMVYDAIALGEPGFFSDEVEKLEWLSRSGLSVVETKRFATPEEVVTYREEIARKRAQLDFDIDGLVVKGRLIDLNDMNRARPQKQIAFKFGRQEALTVLEAVEWSESGHLYTPVAIVRAVEIAGTIVRRASLVHPDLIAELGLAVGAEVIVSKRGDIIPKIERVVSLPDEPLPIIPPAVCATCGSAVVNEGTRVYCSNPECPRRYFHRLRRWITTLDIRDFGEVLIGKLFSDGKIRTIADLYRLQSADLARYEGMGEKSARTALGNLFAVQEVSLPLFVSGFDLDGIAILTVEKLVAAGLSTIESLFAAQEDELASVHGIGAVKARAIRSGLDSVRTEMEDLLSLQVVSITAGTAVPDDAAGTESNEIRGRSFCFTGALERMKRSEAEDTVKKRGGVVKTAVTAGLDYLVTNTPETDSTKNRKARQLSVRVITEEQFLNLLGK